MQAQLKCVISLIDSFDKLNKSNVGLGLKNISSRLKVAKGSIYFEKDISQTYYKITIELPKDEPYE